MASRLSDECHHLETQQAKSAFATLKQTAPMGDTLDDQLNRV